MSQGWQKCILNMQLEYKFCMPGEMWKLIQRLPVPDGKAGEGKALAQMCAGCCPCGQAMAGGSVQFERMDGFADGLQHLRVACRVGGQVQGIALWQGEYCIKLLFGQFQPYQLAA